LFFRPFGEPRLYKSTFYVNELTRTPQTYQVLLKMHVFDKQGIRYIANNAFPILCLDFSIIGIDSQTYERCLDTQQPFE